jgi:hypothetical protein
MLAIIPKRICFEIAGVILLAGLTIVLTSCASKDPAPLIADPGATGETALPWNEQQKWEREGQGAMLNQQRR